MGPAANAVQNVFAAPALADRAMTKSDLLSPSKSNVRDLGATGAAVRVPISLNGKSCGAGVGDGAPGGNCPASMMSIQVDVVELQCRESRQRTPRIAP